MSNDASTTSRGQVGLFALATGQSIGRYTITAVLGQGGFGITYRARDGQLNRDVAIKEYLPASLAVRQDGITVLPRSTEAAEDFIWGRDRFVAEGSTLASLTEAPAIVRVYDFLELNGTAYIVMELVPFKHWNVTPDFKELEFRIMKEPSTRLAAQLTGEVQMTTLPQDLQEQALKSGMAIARGTLPAQRAWMRFHGVYVDTKNSGQYVYPNSPLMNVGVRKALNKAINREELNKAFFSGKGEPLYNTPFHPTREGWNTDWEKNYKEAYGFDLRAAQQALADAGYGSGKQLEVNVLLAANDVVSNAQDMQEAVAGYWRAAGIKVE